MIPINLFDKGFSFLLDFLHFFLPPSLLPSLPLKGSARESERLKEILYPQMVVIARAEPT